MEWDTLKPELNVALNEATLLGLEVDPTRRLAGATFRVLTLPTVGAAPEDARVQILFHPLGRIAASLRNGRWNDANAQIVPIELYQLLNVVQSFGGQPIYGWEFFDVDIKELPRWGTPLSLDWRSGKDGDSHSMCLFQESGAGPARHLDLCLWFDRMTVRHPDGLKIPLEEFAAGGRRWWDGLHSGDQRTAGHGIFAGRPTGREG